MAIQRYHGKPGEGMTLAEQQFLPVISVDHMVRCPNCDGFGEWIDGNFCVTCCGSGWVVAEQGSAE